MSELQENTYFAGRYKLINKLGSGGFSVVWLAEDTMAGDTKIALKIYAPDKGLDKDGIDNFRKEYAITLNLNHSSLLSAKHFDVSDGSPYLIMQFMSKGSALKLIENIDEKRLGKFIFQVSAGLEYLHSYDPAIVHQDIKPDNVLISSKGDFLLTDFGISTRVRRTLTKSAANVGYSGTIAYVPPERYMRNPKPQPEGDIFAFGIMLFEMMTGYLPWNEQGGLGFIGSQIIPPIDAEGFSDAVKNLCISCISFKPEDRPTAGEIKIYAQQYVLNGFWDDSYKPNSVVNAEETSEIDAKKRAEEELKQQALETERRKTKEIEDAAKRKLEEEKSAEEARKKQIADENEKKLKEETERKKQQQELESKRKEELDSKFSNFINSADSSYNASNFKEALGFYQDALKLKDDKYAKSRIEDCDNKLEAERSERKRNDEFKFINKTSQEADVAFSKGKLKEAKNKYQLLLNKDKNNTEATNRLKEIDSIKKQKSIENRRKTVKILIPVIIILVLGGAAAWYFMQPVPPKAGFSANKLTVTEGESITFTSNSENADALKWTFDGGEPSNSVSNKQTVQFNKSGKYSIGLTAINENGENKDYKENYITVKPNVVEKKVLPPEVDFFANTTSIVSGKSVKFTSKSGNAQRFKWTFENGEPSTSEELNPSVKYTKPGKYKVSLTAYNKAGEKTKTKDSYITVAKDIKKPIADFVADVNSIYVGDTVRFYDQSSFAYSRKWVFQGGVPENADMESPAVVYNAIGTYPVKLEVKNPKGSDQISKEVFIEVFERPEVVRKYNFDALVKDADNLFSKDLLAKALEKYQEADQLIPGDTHVQNRIKEINSTTDLNSAYNYQISQADEYFKEENYNKAREEYKKAAELKPEESHPSKMIKRINAILSTNNIAYKIPEYSKEKAKQILVSVTGNTAVVRIEVGDVYKDNKVKLTIYADWKDKKARPMQEVDEEIAIRKRDVSISSSKLHFENFEYADYLAFSNGATLKLVADKGFEGGKVKVSINLMMMLGKLNSSVPQVVSYSNKNPSGNLEIEFEMKKYYKSK
ncbi:MAG: hypothetical protein C0595_01965 [Marinilabiliales bacterium]|nr:MAG: hypothetical protein C0595_01965 [Marinilabiliales bacterium]